MHKNTNYKEQSRTKQNRAEGAIFYKQNVVEQQQPGQLLVTTARQDQPARNDHLQDWFLETTVTKMDTNQCVTRQLTILMPDFKKSLSHNGVFLRCFCVYECKSTHVMRRELVCNVFVVQEISFGGEIVTFPKWQQFLNQNSTDHHVFGFRRKTYIGISVILHWIELIIQEMWLCQ